MKSKMLPQPDTLKELLTRMQKEEMGGKNKYFGLRYRGIQESQ